MGTKPLMALPLRFAKAGRRSVLAVDPVQVRRMTERATARAANDNQRIRVDMFAPQPVSEHVLHAALRHFAQHGLGAAREAHALAETALLAGDRQTYDWWLGITRTLDRRLAAETERAGSRRQPS